MERRKILVFETNLSTVSRYLVAKWMLDRHPGIEKWTIDQDDCDNVLRIGLGPAGICDHLADQEYRISLQAPAVKGLALFYWLLSGPIKSWANKLPTNSYGNSLSITLKPGLVSWNILAGSLPNLPL
ncbi:hypothetical protein NC796_09565 [Aliifodinibius sp. S!AR15-10]|uniref:hypothetical protein n=1 Tax=Aliifodinibius sp. S!AR15-10 TaxID=2950437 RepID=UPI00285632C6|nr:hypothetical protein [Aliifodinibius sp. S!AR15-10]MDR8391385.1 hypothetical protein [Aliifodinibius sp. S!AR15-10]